MSTCGHKRLCLPLSMKEDKILFTDSSSGPVYFTPVDRVGNKVTKFVNNNLYFLMHSGEYLVSKQGQLLLSSDLYTMQDRVFIYFAGNDPYPCDTNMNSNVFVYRGIKSDEYSELLWKDANQFIRLDSSLNTSVLSELCPSKCEAGKCGMDNGCGGVCICPVGQHCDNGVCVSDAIQKCTGQCDGDCFGKCPEGYTCYRDQNGKHKCILKDTGVKVSSTASMIIGIIILLVSIMVILFLILYLFKWKPLYSVKTTSQQTAIV